MPAARKGEATGVPRSASKALRLLALFADGSRGMGLSEVAALAGLPKGTTHRLLLALEEEGFLLQDPDSRKWGLGFQIVHLYQACRERWACAQVATPWMQRLRDQVRETVCLVVEDSGDAICLERVDPEHELRVHTVVGVREPLHCGAGRKLLMAYLPEERCEQVIREKGLRPITSRTVTDPEQLRSELASIRLQGYCVTSGEHNAGASAVAAPLRDASGRVVAALSVTGPSSRLTADRIERVLPHLLDTAREVSRRLGFR